MKNFTLNLSRITILIIMVQSFTKDSDLFAATASNGSVTRFSGNKTELSIETLAPSCHGGKDGVADLTIIGTDKPYTINWSTGTTAEDASGLTAGNYSVTVTGKSGEKVIAEISVPEPNVLHAAISTSSVSCHNGSNGSIDVLVGGGTAPYSITLNGNVSAPAIHRLSAGNYEIMVTDAYGCTTGETVTLGEPAVPFSFETKDVTCHGANNGGVVINPLNPDGHFQYVWSDGSTGTKLAGVKGGDYLLEVLHSDGCVSTYAFAVYEPEPLTLEMKSSDATCESGGTAEVLVSGGEAPYLFNWSDGSEIASLDRLMPGDYTVVVTDSKSCKASGNVKIGGEHSRITLLLTAVSANCALDEDGSIDLHVSGGREPFAYLWSNGNTAEDQLLVSPGMYTVTVTDATGCKQNATIELEAPAPLIASVSEFSSGCNGTEHGFTVLVSGGTHPYRYNWSNGSRSASVSNLADGIYEVTVTDANGCSVQIHKQVAAVSPIEISEEVIHPSGLKKTDGSISVQVAGGNPPYIYEWSDGTSGNTIDGLGAGMYSLNITDARGCSFDKSFALGLGYGEEVASTEVRSPAAHAFELNLINTGTSGLAPAMTISAAQDDHYVVEIFDMTGRKMAVVSDELIRQGEQRTVNIENAGLRAGVYLVKVSSSGLTRTLKFNIIN